MLLKLDEGKTMQPLKFKKLHPEARLPTRGFPSDAAVDVFAFLLSREGRSNTKVIPPRTAETVSTGLLIEPPYGHAVLVCSRSGLASKGVFVTNAPGIVDPDYRGELKVLLYNGSMENWYIKHEDRIAQLLLLPIVDFAPVIVEELSQTERGAGGFGSTGR